MTVGYVESWRELEDCGGRHGGVMKSLGLVERCVRDYAPTDHTTEVVYLSTPITTGPKLLSWLSEQAHRYEDATARNAEIVRGEVMSENLARLAPIRDAIKARLPESHLIDPTTLTMPGWHQSDYHRFSG